MNASIPRPPPPALAFRHEGTALADEWLLGDFIEFGALVTAVPCARLHTRQVLWEWGLTQLTEDAELIVSELMTNAVFASESMETTFPVRLWLLSDKEHVAILVWDANPRPPVNLDPDVDAEWGRGLLLVAASSKRWGSYPAPDIGGKVVWAVIGP
jgi:anti-sigma regulatory factor (Ser/Thr protein kinase)